MKTGDIEINELEKALNQPRNYGIGRITTLKNYLVVFNPDKKRTFIEYKKAKVIYDYSVWRGYRGLEIPKIVYDSLDLPEEIIDNRPD